MVMMEREFGDTAVVGGFSSAGPIDLAGRQNSSSPMMPWIRWYMAGRVRYDPRKGRRTGVVHVAEARSSFRQSPADRH